MTSIVIPDRTWSPRTHPGPAAGVLLVVAVVGVTIATLVTLNDAPRDQVVEIAPALWVDLQEHGRR